MATRTFLHQNADFQSTANWGTAPVTSDVVNLTKAGSQSVTTNVDWSSIDTLTVRVGEQHEGSIATSSSPWLIGDGWTMELDARGVPGFYMSVGGSETVTKATVRSTGINGISIAGSGTITDLLVVAGTVRLSGTLTVTNLRLLGPKAQVILEGDHTITNTYVQAGKLTSQSDLATVYLNGGELNVIGDGANEGDITTLNQAGGVCYYSPDGRTIATLNAFGGVMDMRRTNHPRVITNGNFYQGFLGYLDDGTDNITTDGTLNNYGARVFKNNSLSVTDNVTELSGGDPGDGVAF